MAKKRKRRAVKKSENLEDKRSFFGRIKYIFLQLFKSLILMTKIKIVDTRYNCHNKISYIKNLMHI